MLKSRFLPNVLFAVAAVWPAPARAQVVEYYHLDALGNVRAVTDQAGHVVERHDYLPFGEECTTGPCAGNPAGTNTREFTGKERDAETGLDYFGARYFASKPGRFTTVDPLMLRLALSNPQKWNRYAYSLNNPLRYVDSDGQWPSRLEWRVHQQSIDDSLPQLPAGDREMLKAAQTEADLPENQTTARSFTHAMSGWDKTMHEQPSEARARANDYVRSEIQAAQNYESLGAHANALFHLGLAMHTLQDATSPEHGPFLRWDGSRSNASRPVVSHVFGERKPNPEERKRLDAATRRSYEYFTGARPLPQDFFSDGK